MCVLLLVLLQFGSCVCAFSVVQPVCGYECGVSVHDSVCCVCSLNCGLCEMCALMSCDCCVVTF